MKNKIFLILLILISVATGCTMAPKYTRPAAPIPPQWPNGPAYFHAEDAGDKSMPATGLTWSEFITDTRLRQIIESSLKNNRDLRTAALNVERARELYGIGRVSILPSVNAFGGWYKEHTPADLSSTGKDLTVEQYDVNLGITAWEIDFFGRIRSLRDKALQEYLATDQALRSSKLLLLSSVAQAYLALAADKEVLGLASATLQAQETSYKLIKRRFDVGIASELDLRQAQTQVETARTQVALYTQMVAQDENALNLLAGSPVGNNFLPKSLTEVSLPKNISPGLSSNILLQRPDVVAAEHTLKAANANIGAARAAFFPNITLTTSVGTASSELSGLFKSGSGTWLFNPQIVMPIFDARTWFAYRVTKIDKEISVAQYEKAIQAAFREVADALAEKNMVQQRLEAQQSLVDALKESYRLSESRYNKGIDSYLPVLDAQRSLYSAEQGLIMLRFAQINNLITLYKTLGGGQENN